MAMLNFLQLSAAKYGIGGCGLVASYVLMYGLWRMSATTTSVYGIRIAGAAMLMAMLAGFLYLTGSDAAAGRHLAVNLALASTALAVGGATGWWRARGVAAAVQPQLTALFNALCAAAAVAIASIELFAHRALGSTDLLILAAAWLAVIALTGSLMAWAKLNGVVRFTLRLRARRALLGTLMMATFVLGLRLVSAPSAAAAQYVSHSESAFFGCGVLWSLLVTSSISPVDMPVAESLITAVTGAAVALLGIVLRMPALTIVGSLVAGGGLQLARLRARSTNRTIVGALLRDANEAGDRSRESRSLDAGDAAIFMNYARKVIIVPGYGLAAAQGQHKLHELMKLLMSAGVEVKLALHPMAGRMPGQMAVILEEAHVPDHLILPLADVGDAVRGADVVLVIGASDVVNPSADHIKSLPMYGIPAMDAGTARKLYAVKRGAGAGYSGIENPVFRGEHCEVIYGDAQIALIKMVEALRTAGVPVAA